MIVSNRYLFALFFLLSALSITACVPEPVSIDEVVQIISEKCVRCHSEKLVTLPELAYKQYGEDVGDVTSPSRLTTSRRSALIVTPLLKKHTLLCGMKHCKQT